MDQPEVKTHSADAHDAHAIAALIVEGWRQVYSAHHFRGGPELARIDSQERQWRHDLLDRSSRAGAVLARDPSSVLGVFAYRPALDPVGLAEIVAVAVGPAAQGQGIGRMLVQDGLLQLRHEGYREVIVWIWSGAPEVERFFAHMGFRSDDSDRHSQALGMSLHERRYRRSLIGAAVG